MNFKLITELPTWWILFCIIAGLAFAYLLYRRDHSFDGIHKWLRKTLFAFRAMAVFILSILLLTPLIKSFSREKEKPLLIIAQDNSQSLVLNRDSAFYTNPDGYAKSMDKLMDDLKERYEVQPISFGDKVSDKIDYSFRDKQTDFSALQKQLAIKFGNRNVGAIVIASDGLYNRGSSPLYNNELKVPVYTIALGDTTVQRDLLISRVNYNKVVYLGNSFPLEVTVNARQCNGEKSKITVQQDSSILFSRDISISGNRFSQLIPIMLDAKKPGLVHYKIKVSSVSGEMTTVNNQQDIYFEIVESKQKILIVANSPHPDLAAIKKGIESSQNYSVKISMASEVDKVKDYNLIILHNLPSSANPVNNLLSQINSGRIPVWFILGAQTSVSLFNNTQSGLEITGDNAKLNTVQAVVNGDFSRFTVSEDLKRMMPSFPPLLAPFGQYKQTTDNAVLLEQQIGSVSTDVSLQLFNDNGEYRKGILCGEGIWRWRISDFSANNNFNSFNEWLLKSVQNLSVKENKTHFRLINKTTFSENEPVTLDAEAYDDNYELINSPDISISLFNSDKKSFSYTFSKTEKSYTLNAGYFPPGQYRFKANVKIGDKLYNAEGELSVAALQAEQTETVADHQLLFSLSSQSGGTMFFPAQIDELSKALLSRDDIKTITYSHYKLRDLVDWKLVFYIILGLLTLEWFLRKRAGAY